MNQKGRRLFGNQATGRGTSLETEVSSPGMYPVNTAKWPLYLEERTERQQRDIDMGHRVEFLFQKEGQGATIGQSQLLC